MMLLRIYLHGSSGSSPRLEKPPLVVPVSIPTDHTPQPEPRLSLHSINSSLASHHGNEMGLGLSTLVDTSERQFRGWHLATSGSLTVVAGTSAKAGSLTEAAEKLTWKS